MEAFGVLETNVRRGLPFLERSQVEELTCPLRVFDLVARDVGLLGLIKLAISSIAFVRSASTYSSHYNFNLYFF